MFHLVKSVSNKKLLNFGGLNSYFTRSYSTLREDDIEKNFLDELKNGIIKLPENHQDYSFESTGMKKQDALDIIKSMFITRICHNVSRRAALEGKVYYTIGPGGSEGIAGCALAVEKYDPAFLHYRDTAFQVMRSLNQFNKSPKEIVDELMLSYTVSAKDKVTGGRHKALGGHDINIIPTTSTIASHFPRAVGLAASIPLTKQIEGIKPNFDQNSIVISGGGDATVNHSVFQTSVNFVKYLKLGMYINTPSLTIISDNEIGISVETPPKWVETNLKNEGLPYFKADGTNIFDVYSKTKQAANLARSGNPSFLHLKLPRLFNHAGSDDGNYQTREFIENQIQRDPLNRTAGLLLENNLISGKELQDMYLEISDMAKKSNSFFLYKPVVNSNWNSTAESRKYAPYYLKFVNSLDWAVSQPKLESLQQLQEAIHPKYDIKETQNTSTKEFKITEKSMILKDHINKVLDESLTLDPNVILIGEDIGKKGGNYGVTTRLQKKFGGLKVRDSLLDETNIIGLANGMSLNGILPVIEICYLAYLHNAIDQLRGEAATLSFFSNGNYKNGFIMRISGGGHTAFGGHFHNENALAFLLDIPGIIVLYPSNGPDYVKLFRQAKIEASKGKVVIIIEPIKLYAEKKFGEKQIDWTFKYPQLEEVKDLSDLNFYDYSETTIREPKTKLDSEINKNTKLAIVTYGNGTTMSLEAQRILKEEHNINCTVIETPVLVPMSPNLLKNLENFDQIIFADESREQMAPSSYPMAKLLIHSSKKKLNISVDQIAGANSFIPLGAATQIPGLYLSPNRIVESAIKLIK